MPRSPLADAHRVSFRAWKLISVSCPTVSDRIRPVADIQPALALASVPQPTPRPARCLSTRRCDAGQVYFHNEAAGLPALFHGRAHLSAKVDNKA